MSEIIPNFLVIGAQKAGTTWLSQVLPEHPDIFMPEREVRYFNDHFDEGVEWYLSWFDRRNQERVVGEKTPGYLWVPSPYQIDFPDTKRRDMPEQVHAFNPEMRLIVSLRDPVRRAVSAFYHHMRAGRIGLKQRITDVAQLYGIVDRGFYPFQLQQWFQHFPQDQFQILIFERDIVKRPAETAGALYEFLEVDASFTPSVLSKRYNRSWSPFALFVGRYSRFLARIVNRLPAVADIRYPNIDVKPEEIAWLADLYGESNQSLSELLGIDLSMWTAPTRSGEVGS